MKIELNMDLGVSIFRNGFENCAKEIFKNEKIKPEEKELWVLLYFTRREKSYLKGPQTLSFEYEISENDFYERIEGLKNQELIRFENEIMYIEIKK